MTGIRLGYSLLTVRPGQIGGAETYVRGLLTELSCSDEIERLDILANREVQQAYAAYAGPAVSLKRIDGMEPGGSTAARLLRLLAGYAAPDRLIAESAASLDLVHFPVAVGIPRPRSVPWAVTLHDVAHHAVPEHFSRAERAYRAFAYDQSARRADVVFTDSEHARGQIIEFLGVDPERVIAIHLGIDYDFFAAGEGNDDAALAGLRLPERFIYYPANMWPHKNHLVLVQALGAARDRDVHLVLTGQTYGRDQELRDTAREAGVSDRVHHLGYVPRETLPALYRRATALVFPSLFEGFGFPPLEAMAAGCAVGTSHAGSLREVVGEAALVFDPTDPEAIAASIDRLTGDPSLRAALRERGRDHARSFTWAAAAQAHLRVYRRLVDAGPRGSGPRK